MMQTPALPTSNPLEGLTPWTLEALLAEGERGNFATLQWLYFHLEKANPTLRACARRLRAAVSRLDWRIVCKPCADPRQRDFAEGQRETLATAYQAVENFHEAVDHLASADLRGFAHLEKIYARTGPDPWKIVELRPVPQYYWQRAGGAWRYNRELRTDGAGGERINREDWIIHELDDPADEMFAFMHLKCERTEELWAGLFDDFGVPAMFFVCPPNQSPEQERAFQNVAEKACSRSRGTLPHGSKVLFPRAGQQGTEDSHVALLAAALQERIEYVEDEAATGALTISNALRTQARSGDLAEVHQRLFRQLSEALAGQIAETLQRDFDAGILRRLHPGEPALAYFEFAHADPEKPSRILDHAAKFAQIGFVMDAQELAERTRYKLSRRTPLATEAKK